MNEQAFFDDVSDGDESEPYFSDGDYGYSSTDDDDDDSDDDLYVMIDEEVNAAPENDQNAVVAEIVGHEHHLTSNNITLQLQR
jgi:hypothetical protein